MNAELRNTDRFESDMTEHSQIEKYLPEFALGNLEREDADLIAEHLSACESCQALMRSYEQTVGLLAFGAPQVIPPESLKSELMRRIRINSSARISKKPETKARSMKSLFQWFSPALATASLIVVISLATVNIIQWNQKKIIHNQLSAPLKIFKMKGTQLAPHADGTFVIGQDNLHGVLVVSDLPEIPKNKQFQLWLTKNGEKSSGGAFSTTPLGYGVMKISSPNPLPEYQSVTLTIEPFGGSLIPSGSELMVGNF